MAGRIEVIAGSMFAGKTGELILRLERAKIAKKLSGKEGKEAQVTAYKHSLDARYDDVALATHPIEGDALLGRRYPAVPVASALMLERHWKRTPSDIIGIDEAQFFEPLLANVALLLASKGVRVIIAGLDMDSDGNPFGPMAALLAIAEKVTKVHAICVTCGSDASHTFYKRPVKQTQIEVGAAEAYEARCRPCWHKGQQERKAAEQAAMLQR